MIKLEIDSKDYDLDADLRSRIVDRIGGLDEFMNTLDEGHVTVAWKGGPHEQTKVSAEVWGGGHRFDASDTDWKPVVSDAGYPVSARVIGRHIARVVPSLRPSGVRDGSTSGRAHRPIQR